MRYWLVLGLLLAGCGVGALLTGFLYLLQLRKIKADLQPAAPSGSQEQSQVTGTNSGESRRSA